MNYSKKIIMTCSIFCFFISGTVWAKLTPLLVPSLDTTTNKYTGKSVIADSIDNQAPNQQFRDRTYYYDLAITSTGKAYVLYAQPKPLRFNSSLPTDLNREKSDIILAIETESGWHKQTLTTEGAYQTTGLQIEADSKDNLHLIYIRKLTKNFGNNPEVVDHLMYRKIEQGVLSNEMEIGNINAIPPNFAGLGAWRTRLAIAPDDSAYMIREGGTEGLLKPSLKLLIPNGSGNWNSQTIKGLPDMNWIRLGEFLIDSDGQAHIILADYAFNSAGNPYTAASFSALDHQGYHNLWYVNSTQLNGAEWKATQLIEDPGNPQPSIYNFQFWPDLALSENNNPAIANWQWHANTPDTGQGAPTVFFQQNSNGTFQANRTTRTFDNVSFRPGEPLAGMGPGLVHDSSGWHGVWDSSHPRPFEHQFGRGGIMYRYSPQGTNWTSYQPIAEFSAEGYCIVEIDKQNRLNVLVLGDHTDTQLYLLRYQLPNDKLMEAYADRSFYYSGESITMHGRVQPGAEGDFYVAALSTARPEINQEMEIWQLTNNLTWQKINSLNQLQPLLTLPSGGGINFNNTLGILAAGQVPFDKQDTDYTIYSLVTKPGTHVFENQWVTPLFSQKITVNKSLPQ